MDQALGESTKKMNYKEVNESLDQLNPVLFGKGSRLSLAYVNYNDLREQDLNANSMTGDMFNQLVQNIKNNKNLESLPLCATRPGSDQLEIVSGHHRIKAARSAGIEYGLVLLYKDLTNDEIRAKQLSHNSIAGSSDPQIIAQIFAEITDMANKLEAYIDPAIVGDIPDPVSVSAIDIDPMDGSKVATFVFLSTQADIFEKLAKKIPANSDMIYLGHKDAFEKFRTAVSRVRGELGVKAMPTAIAHMGEITLAYIEEQEAKEK
jgi:hypothetical protein